MRTPHTGVYRGKRVQVEMLNGVKFIDKFLEKDSQHIYFENRTIQRGKLKSFKIIKGNPREVKE